MVLGKNTNLTFPPHFKAFLATNETSLVLNYLLLDFLRETFYFPHSVFQSLDADDTKQPPLHLYRLFFPLLFYMSLLIPKHIYLHFVNCNLKLYSKGYTFIL